MLGIFNKISSSVRQGFKRYVTDGLKLYMPYKQKTGVVGFVGTGSTSFDGSNDYVDCGTSLGTALGDNYAGSLTVTMWFKADVTSGDDGLFNMSSFSGTHGEMGIVIDSNSIKFHLNNGGWTRSFSFTDTSSWHHLVCVYDTSGEDASLMYLDGVSVGSVSGTFPADSDMDLSGLKVILGAYYSSSYTFNGNIKNVAIWSRALTATEIQNVMYKQYNEIPTSSRLTDGLVSWWALDDADVYVKSLASAAVGSLTRNITSELTTGETYTVKFDVELDTATSVLCSVGTGAYGTQIYSSGYITSYPNTSDAFTFSSGNVYLTVNITPNTSIAYIKSIQILDSNSNLVWEDFTTSGDWTESNATASNRYIDNEGSNHGVSGDGSDSDTFPTHTYERYGQSTPVIPRAIDNARTVQADAIGAGSASFDGVDDYISLGNDSSLQVGTSDFSWCAWIYRTADDGAIFNWGDIASPPAWQLYENGAELLLLRIDDGGGGLLSWSSTALPEDEWVHVCLTMDRDSATGIKMYFNGIDVGVTEDDATGQQLTLSGGSIGAYIGVRYGGGLTAYHPGNICQVGIWDAALDQEQIQSIMEKTYEELTASEKTNLVSYWPLDVDASDSHGDNDGTLT